MFPSHVISTSAPYKTGNMEINSRVCCMLHYVVRIGVLLAIVCVYKFYLLIYI